LLDSEKWPFLNKAQKNLNTCNSARKPAGKKKSEQTNSLSLSVYRFGVVLGGCQSYITQENAPQVFYSFVKQKEEKNCE